MSDPEISSLSHCLHKSVESLWSGIKNPGNYYKGKGTVLFPVPENILLFYRDRFHPQSLGAETSFHYRHVLLFNLARPIRIFLDGSIIHLHQGEGLLILPYQYHRFIREGQGWLSLAFLTFEIPPTIYFEGLRYTPFTYSDETLLLLEETARTFILNQARTLPYCTALLLSHIAESFDETDHQVYQRAQTETLTGEILKTVYHEKTRTVRGLAATLGYSENYLRTLFKRTMGQTLGRFIIEVRMTEAMRLLSQGTTPIGAIAECCGYESIYTFSRAFKDFAGENPSAYRKRRQAPRDGAPRDQERSEKFTG
ncbi:AraC-type DNA-binding protein [Alkalispirochaeta americana]|uniref:AraC-type DNA-binding protein n=1 Tax=Alkalispirochaeta americana TaxID=159291 RepID=A0A1N6N694_9SPIO|nr:helix-turn-helix transcriptional regulator [Alkalispirochaeta americana]SIP87573.1 AraC-type DNA-binding protein [Alkalispirochaeta americana]